MIDEDRTKTLFEISTDICSEFGVSFSESSIYKHINGFNYSFKRLPVQPVRRNTLDTLNSRKEYADWF